MESVKLLLLSCVKNPGLAAVQQRAQNASSVDLDLGIFRQLLVGPYSLSQLGNGSSTKILEGLPEPVHQLLKVFG